MTKPRPTFDEYFLMLSFGVSLRSEDPDIQHGAIIVDKNNHIIGTGYNATIKGSDKSKIPINVRDEKRKWMIHAEENAILNCLVNPLNLSGETSIYVTGLPCVNCLQRIINFGIKRVVFADRQGSITENEESRQMRQKLIEMSNISFQSMNINNPLFKNFL